MRTQLIPLTILITLTLTVSMPAQELEFKKWDAAGTIGLLGSSRRDFIRSSSYYGDTLALAWNLDASRYFTTHIKATAGVMTTNSRRVYESPSYYTGEGFAYGWSKVRPTMFTGALAYQFFENEFAHPYIAAGVGFNALSEEREQFSFISPTRINPVPVVSNETHLQVRPFAAVGCKSYFNQRTFMKSELLFSSGPHGFSHAMLRAGFGIDF